MQCNKSDILERLQSKSSVLICAASFDERWKVMPSLLSSSMDVYVISHRQEKERYITGLGFNCHILDVSYDKAFDLWKGIADKVISLIQRSNCVVSIDITAFDTELLLLTINQIKLSRLQDKVEFLYLGAESYSKIIMSGVKDIRTVLGYPGIFSPSKRYHHLVILLGFELDRAKELILIYEPSSISLGIAEDCYKSDFYLQNKLTAKEIHEFVASLGQVFKDVSQFSFSAKDAIKTKSAILSEIEKFSDSNILISPMNTKVSTVGAALAALENEELKLCYVEPLEYDTDNYSKPGKTVTVFNI